MCKVWSSQGLSSIFGSLQKLRSRWLDWSSRSRVHCGYGELPSFCDWLGKFHIQSSPIWRGFWEAAERMQNLVMVTLGKGLKAAVVWALNSNSWFVFWAEGQKEGCYSSSGWHWSSAYWVETGRTCCLVCCVGLFLGDPCLSLLAGLCHSVGRDESCRGSPSHTVCRKSAFQRWVSQVDLHLKTALS